jgi:AbrB family looped-hinge helix DNA binding protein
MPYSTITSKGQVTIPRQIREKLELKVGDKLNFQYQKNGTVLLAVASKKVNEVYGMLAYRAKKPVSVEQMNEGIRNHIRNKYT